MTQVRRHPAPVKFNSDGWALLESHHDIGFFMDWRRDDFPKWLFAIGGAGMLETAEQSWPIVAGALLGIPEMKKHRIVDEKGNPLSLYGLCLDPARFCAGHLIEQALPEVRVDLYDERTIRVQHILRELLMEEREARPGYRELQVAIVTRFLILMLRGRPSPVLPQHSSHQRVESYVNRLRARFWESDDLDRVAQGLGLSRRRFTQLFREITGTSWLNYLTRLRMTHALKLLQTTPLSVSSVAFECGYGELTHFYRTFKSSHGKAPGEMRQR